MIGAMWRARAGPARAAGAAPPAAGAVQPEFAPILEPAAAAAKGVSFISGLFHNDTKRREQWYARHGRSTDKNTARYWAAKVLR